MNAGEVSTRQRAQTGSYKRKQLFMREGFQTKLAKELFVMFLFGGTLLYGAISILGTLQADDAISSSAEAILATIYFSAFTVVALALLAIASIFYSHRVAGPAYKISRYLMELNQGAIGRGLRLRESDHLKEIAVGIERGSRKFAKSIADVGDVSEELRALDSANPKIQELASKLDTIRKEYQLPDVSTR
ncbi:MAG: hypothetical protein K0U93_27585 [Gammaproteobacteria bacterium]|nr:hypothetical protein [Gammaproteobacteria bacterium]